jgi:predicted ATPase/class 3 adenylate cyclase
MRADLPSGTVTFLFTDVEGSTRLLHDLGAESYAEALAEHRRVIREACARAGGVEVDTQGDAFFFAFPTAPGALGAARELSQALTGGPIQVRVGVHTGTPLLAEEGYVGGDVHRAARIGAAGHGGQVLVSSSTAALVVPSGSEQQALPLADLGEHRFRDLAAAERVYQLGEGEFPPLKTLYQTNLPVPANPLVGRKKEVLEVLRFLSAGEARLVTVTGPGGIGKTRFAVAAAGEAAEAFPDGVWFVPLAPLRDPELVLPSLGHAIGAEGDLVRHLDGRTTLLLLDNFEPVIGAAAGVAELVAALPSLRVLVTSREPLRVAAEREYRLPPLPESPAVELFRQRASAVVADVDVDYRVAAEICERLDGLPLAIELAAARVKVFDPETLRERLEQRLPLLVSRARDLPERQRTLRSTIAWSYELLAPDEQELFRRLAVFSGGATLDAIEEVTGGDAELVESLVDKSLLRRRGDRFVMLETIRELALELFGEDADAETIRARHAQHFRAVMEDANLSSGTLDLRKPMRHDVAFAEQDNVRAALAWTLETGRSTLGLELATAVDWFWVLHDPDEGRRWFEALFERSDEVPLGARAHGLRSYAACADIAGRDELAAELYGRSLAAFEELGDDLGRARLLHRLGIQAMRRGELVLARELLEASWELHENNENETERTWDRSQILGTLGAVARDEGDVGHAFELVRESLDLVRQVGIAWWEMGVLGELAALALLANRVDEASSLARESLVHAKEMRDRPGRVLGVGLLAVVAAERGELGRAGRLWGAVEDEEAVAPLGGWRRHRPACEARIRERADDDFERARAAGSELSLDEAVEHALGES